MLYGVYWKVQAASSWKIAWFCTAELSSEQIQNNGTSLIFTLKQELIWRIVVKVDNKVDKKHLQVLVLLQKYWTTLNRSKDFTIILQSSNISLKLTDLLIYPLQN